MPQFKTYWRSYDHQISPYWGLLARIKEAKDWYSAREQHPGAVVVLDHDPARPDRDVLIVADDPRVEIEIHPEADQVRIIHGDQAVDIPFDVAHALAHDLQRAALFGKAMATAHLWPVVE